jgi:protein-L-isoaspartate(D-aspartate) O-methyltransferase
MKAMTDLAAQRRAYAEGLRAIAHLRSDELVEAFARVPRERFLGPGPWQIAAWVAPGRVEYRTTEDADPRHLYDDVLVAIDASRWLNNGQPSGLARWFDALGPRNGERVVHVGCGTGYYTAVLAELVGPTGHVVAIEIDPELAGRARENLAYLGHVQVCEGDGGQHDAGAADAIFVNAGATHPRSIWTDSLRSGGRLLLPITISHDASGMGSGGMFLITRQGASFAAELVSPVGIFPCLGSRDSQLNEELSRKQGLTAGGGLPEWRAVRSLRREPHEPDATCWLHTPEGCLSTLSSGAPSAP